MRSHETPKLARGVPSRPVWMISAAVAAGFWCIQWAVDSWTGQAQVPSDLKVVLAVLSGALALLIAGNMEIKALTAAALTGPQLVQQHLETITNGPYRAIADRLRRRHEESVDELKACAEQGQLTLRVRDDMGYLVETFETIVRSTIRPLGSFHTVTNGPFWSDLNFGFANRWFDFNQALKEQAQVNIVRVFSVPDLASLDEYLELREGTLDNLEKLHSVLINHQELASTGDVAVVKVYVHPLSFAAYRDHFREGQESQNFAVWDTADGDMALIVSYSRDLIEGRRIISTIRFTRSRAETARLRSQFQIPSGEQSSLPAYVAGLRRFIDGKRLQEERRPRVGQLAVDLGMLTEAQVRSVLESEGTDRFLERGRRLGLLQSDLQVQTLLHVQEKWWPRN